MKQPKKPTPIELAPLFWRATVAGQVALMQLYYDLRRVEELDIPEPKQKPHFEEDEFDYAGFMAIARLIDDD